MNNEHSLIKKNKTTRLLNNDVADKNEVFFLNKIMLTFKIAK